MNLLVLSQYYWPESFRINDVVKGLVERGHEVTVLTGQPNYPSGKLFDGYGFMHPRRQTNSGAKILRVPLVPRGSGGILRLIANYLSFAVTASITGPVIAPDEIDAILVYEPSPITVGIPAMALKFFSGAPVLFWLQDLWPESLSATSAITSPKILKIVEIFVRWLYKGCDRILVQSEAFIPAVRRLGGDVNKTHYFPNSAEPFYRPVTVPNNAPERDLMPDGFRVTFAGNIGVAQDFDTIIEAAIILKTIKEIHFIILGDGRMRPYVQRKIWNNDLQSTVHLLGQHPPERMPYFFSLSDALLVTLKRDPIFALTIPSKIQSYLACGRPIIAALDGEGARVIKQARAGMTCHSEDPSNLAETILAFYNLPADVREAMGENGRNCYESDFEREVLLNKLEGWMMKLAGDKHGN